ncbi:MAG: DUF4180 domain-containing protein [Devosia marina]|uniref:DUF4180 domain-containing protein n=1 Tax=Devosia marina TaxID=2683198 RepID=UPI0032EF9E45
MAIEKINGVTVYFVSAKGPALASGHDALDLLGETNGTETDMIVVPAGRFAEEFFNLSTRHLGRFFQKLQNYEVGRHLFAADREALEAGLRGKA